MTIGYWVRISWSAPMAKHFEYLYMIFAELTFILWPATIINKTSDLWKPVVRFKSIPADIETSYLHLRTDSYEGSGDQAQIYYEDEEGKAAGGFSISFSLSAMYAHEYCQSYAYFPQSLPAELDKHWVIEKRGFRTFVYCNGRMVVDFTISSATCNDDRNVHTWPAIWARKVKSIKISSLFVQAQPASDFYYIGELILSLYFTRTNWLATN